VSNTNPKELSNRGAANLNLQDVLQDHPGLRAWVEDVEDEDNISGWAHEGVGQEQDDGEDEWDPAKDNEVGLEAWMVEIEEAAKRDIQDLVSSTVA
jgi:hypothetical protein